MKHASKASLSLIAVLFLATGYSSASTNSELFQTVPAGDPTYGRLQTLETDGLLPEGASSKPLTRYDVAELILKARKNYDAIVVADANVAPSANSASDIPPLPSMPGLPDLTSPVGVAANAAAATPVTAPADAMTVPTPISTPVPAVMPVSTTVNTAPTASTDDNENYAAPPPPSEAIMNSSDNSAAVATPPPVAPTPKATPNYAQHPELLKSAEEALTSLDDAYEVELQAVMQAKGILLDDLNKAESDQYQLWRDVKSITDSPNVSINGVGRMFAVSQNVYGPFTLYSTLPVTTYVGATATVHNPPYAMSVNNPETQYMNGYLDLMPNATITKQLEWNAILRVGTSALPLTGDFAGNNAFDTVNNVGYDTLAFRWIALRMSPDFMTMDIGDFYEAYTPLTLWNRNNLDILYKPEPIARADDDYKYESFFNHEPDWPFRGIRIGTALGWPDSNVLDKLKVSAFVHMLSNGFNSWLSVPNTAALSNTNTIGQTNYFTDFIYAGQAELDLKKFYMGDLSVQFSGQAHLVILDQILNDNPNYTTDYFINGAAVTEYIYNPNDPNTWAHQYRISSFEPQMKIGFGGDVYLGLQYEGSFSEYQDDKLVSGRTVSDFAIHGDPYLQIDDSKFSFEFLNVGPNYYSPLAQSRQDNINTIYSNSGANVTLAPGMGVFTAPLRGQYFLIDNRTLSGVPLDFVDVPRANAIFTYYDRTQDAVFPYGLATPDRQGVGFTVDLQTMGQHLFKLPAAVYFVSEIIPNEVINSGGNGTTVVDAYNGQAPDRSFVYVNLGPSVDFGPMLQMTTPLELGTNLRYEQTNSAVGTLTNVWSLTGVRVGLFSWWEMTAAVGFRTSVGSDMGIDGTTLARYSYTYNNQDLGQYEAFTVNDSENDLLLSTTFNMDKNSKLHLDYCFSTGQNSGTINASGLYPGAYLNGTINNQYVEMTYEIKF